MPIAQADIDFFRSATVSDTNSNGGRMSASEITSGAVNNVFPTVGESERTAGSTKHRKIFLKNANDGDLTLFVPKVYLDKYTNGNDRITFFVATQTDIQSAITGSEKKYGCGKLDANISASATSMSVEVEDGATNFLLNGDKVRITDKADINSGGNEEYVTISGAPGVVGNIVTFNFTPAVQNGYSASNARVMNVYEPTDLVANFASLVVTSAAGTFNGANLLPDNIGGIEQNWTLTFTSATVFNISGDTVGAQGSGSVGAGAQPNNADFGKPYFVMQAAGFGGTYVNGDTITFTTHPGAVAVWLKQIVPAGSAAAAPNTATIVLDGETA